MNVEHIPAKDVDVLPSEADWQSRHLESERRKAEIRDRIHKQAEQGQKDQIHMVAVEVIQQIARRRPEQNGGRRHGGEHDAHPGAGDANFLAVHRDDGDGGIKGRQHQQVGDKEKDEPSVPDFFSFFHIR